ncbi:Transglutaminase-like superfamily protein [Agromyces sp. CF514]|uniref:transglutaminase domain-containing protein n=1 Tax=Agromyces sp. CF514 TaxID=1881031 RepID=UPI0008E6F1FB|nr:transglutaminase domain-containing protein [Agromyces sp. CF514]SFR68204.1 Transglutaminase-like superfamily protein [Agromyces sp. CF514]
MSATRGRGALGLGYVVVAGILATLSAWPVYESARMTVVAAVGMAAGLGLAWAARRLPVDGLARALLLVPATAVVFALVVVPVTIPAAAGGPSTWVTGIRDGFVGVVVGWRQLLTLALPLGEYQAVLVPFLLVMLVGTLVAAMLVAPDRRSSPFAVLVAFGMSGFGLAFGSSAVSEPVAIGPALVPAPRELVVAVGGLLAAVAWLLLRSRAIRAVALRRASADTVQQSSVAGWPAVRRRALAAALVLVGLVAGAVVTPVAAGSAQREALRDRVEPEVVLRQTATPLAAYRAAFATDRIDEAWLDIEGDTTGVERLRLATLDAYDGETFHVAAGSDAAAGPASRFSRLPGAAVRSAGDAAFTVTVREGYSGIWVPAPLGLRTAPDFTGARAGLLDDGFHRAGDGATSIDIAPVDREPAGSNDRGLVAGDEYRLVAAPDRAAPLEEPGDSPLLDPEDHPALATWIGLQAQPDSSAGFLELVRRLRERGYLSHAASDGADAATWIGALGGGYTFIPSYSGHSKARIEALFTQLVDQQRSAGPEASDADLVAGVGDDEQFAVAVALLARALGYDSRVVLGFRLAGGDEVAGIATCADTCTGGALSIWAEVSPGDASTGAAGVWTPIDATPQFEVAPSLIHEGEQLPEHPTTPDRPDTATIDPPSARSESSEAEAETARDAEPAPFAMPAWARWTALSTAALLLALLPAIVLLAAKGGRSRRRRREPLPEVRIVGAWDELLDLYADFGVLAAESGSRSATARASGRAAAGVLAGIVGRAVFAGDPPGVADADAAWAIVDAERTALAAESRVRRTLAARLSFASLARAAAPARSTARTPVRVTPVRAALEEPAR